MTIECANCDRNAFTQTSLARPCASQPANGVVNRVNTRSQTRAQGGEVWAELGKKFCVGIAAPFGIPHGFVAGGANARDVFIRVLGAGEHRRHIIAKLDP